MPRIIVTQQDIDKGTPQDEHDCAIARAAKRAFPRAQSVEVDTYFLNWVDKTGEKHWVDFTERESAFVKAFDNWSTIPLEEKEAALVPFSFDVDKDKTGQYRVIV